jgi:hypothetical protein
MQGTEHDFLVVVDDEDHTNDNPFDDLYVEFQRH